MNRIALFAAALLVGISSLSIASAQDKALKVAIVDMPKVFAQYYKTQEAEKRIQDQQNIDRKEMEDRSENYQKLVEQVKQLQDQINDKSISDAQKKEKTDLFTQKIQDIKQRELENNNFVRDATRRLQEQHRAALEGIMTEISKVVTKVSKDKNYNLVLAKTEFPSAVLYSDIADLSNDIITELNKDKPADAAKAK